MLNFLKHFHSLRCHSIGIIFCWEIWIYTCWLTIKSFAVSNETIKIVTWMGAKSILTKLTAWTLLIIRAFYWCACRLTIDRFASSTQAIQLPTWISAESFLTTVIAWTFLIISASWCACCITIDNYAFGSAPAKRKRTWICWNASSIYTSRSSLAFDRRTWISRWYAFSITSTFRSCRANFSTCNNSCRWPCFCIFCRCFSSIYRQNLAKIIVQKIKLYE